MICPDPLCDLYYDAVLNEKDEEDEITDIHVEFFGWPKSHAWVGVNNVSPFCETTSGTNKNTEDKPWKSNKSYQIAMEEALKAVSLTCEERLRSCTFKTVDDTSKRSNKGITHVTRTYSAPFSRIKTRKHLGKENMQGKRQGKGCMKTCINEYNDFNISYIEESNQHFSSLPKS